VSAGHKRKQAAPLDCRDDNLEEGGQCCESARYFGEPRESTGEPIVAIDRLPGK